MNPSHVENKWYYQNGMVVNSFAWWILFILVTHENEEQSTGILFANVIKRYETRTKTVVTVHEQDGAIITVHKWAQMILRHALFSSFLIIFYSI